jgi:hypothetical protein
MEGRGKWTGRKCGKGKKLEMERDMTVHRVEESKGKEWKETKPEKRKGTGRKSGKGLEGRVEIDRKEEWKGKGKRTDKNQKEEGKGRDERGEWGRNEESK